MVVRRATAIDRVVDAIAESFTTELNSVSVVNDAVEDGVGEGRIADYVVPLGDGNLTGDQEGMEVVPILDDFEQIAALFCSQDLRSKIVQYEDVNTGKCAQ